MYQINKLGALVILFYNILLPTVNIEGAGKEKDFYVKKRFLV